MPNWTALTLRSGAGEYAKPFFMLASLLLLLLL